MYRSFIHLLKVAFTEVMSSYTVGGSRSFSMIYNRTNCITTNFAKGLCSLFFLHVKRPDNYTYCTFIEKSGIMFNIQQVAGTSKITATMSN